jgi:hypothetical protein
MKLAHTPLYSDSSSEVTSNIRNRSSYKGEKAIYINLEATKKKTLNKTQFSLNAANDNSRVL